MNNPVFKRGVWCAALIMTCAFPCAVKAEFCSQLGFDLTNDVSLNTSCESNTFTRCVVVADFDQDGETDIVASDRFCNEISILLNAGQGEFHSSFVIATTGSEWNRIIVARDFNNDGWPDIASASELGASVFLNQGLDELMEWSGFAPSITYEAGLTPHWVESVDLNQDGYEDLLLADMGQSKIECGFYTFLNKGDGTFDDATWYNLGWFARCISIIGADLNGDGNPELLIADNNTLTSNKFHVFDNLGSDSEGVWLGMSYRTQFVIMYGACSLRTADLDNDGDLDVILAHRYHSGTLSLFWNDGAGNLTHEEVYAPDTVEHVEPMDVDQDGLIDLVLVVKEMNHVTVYKNEGEGQFSSRLTLQVGLEPKFAATADFNFDGFPDVVTANSFPGVDYGTITVHMNLASQLIETCDGDTSCDGKVSTNDLLEVIAAWGSHPTHPSDLNLDGWVGIDDLLLIVAWWGPCVD